MAVLKGKEKALIFLSSLGDEVSRKILKHLPDDMSNRISEELTLFDKPSPEAIGLVFRELNRFTLSAPQGVSRSALSKPESSVSVEEMKQAKQLLTVLQSEQAQVVAFVLKNVEEAVRDNYYELLSPGRRNELKRVDVVDIPIARNIFKAIDAKLIKKAI